MLNYKWKFLGWILVTVGIICTIFYVNYDFRLSMPVFAIFSYFMEMKFLVSYTTNVTDEIMMICLLLGFLILVFSREKDELAEFEQMRGKALFKSLFYNSIFMLFSIIFIYGQGFFVIMVLNMYSLFILYLIFYNRMKIKLNHS